MTDFNIATREDLDNLEKYSTDRWQSRRHKYETISSEECPWEGNESALGFPGHCEVNGCYISDQNRNAYYKYDYNTRTDTKTTAHAQLLKKPFFVNVTFNNYREHDNTKFHISDELVALVATAHTPELVTNEEEDDRYYYSRSVMRWGRVLVSVEKDGHRFYLVMPWQIAERAFGLRFTEDLDVSFTANGGFQKMPAGWRDKLLSQIKHGGYRNEITGFNYTLDAISAITSKLPMGKENLEIFLTGTARDWPVAEVKLSGIKKTWMKLQPFADELLETDPLTFCCYRSLASSSNRSIDGVKVSSVFNEVLKDANSAKDIKRVLKEFYQTQSFGNGKESLEACVKRLPLYKDKRRQVLKSQANRAFTKVMQECESLTIDKTKCKRTWAAIEEGKLPIGIFFRKQEQYYLLNDNWDLWEGMFKQGHGDIACEIATAAAGRTTYEKDLMSYFYFILHGLPDYLKRHTGKKWTCKPKYVNTESELEPPKEEGGIARKRSALTPIVDNEACTVEVPYAAIQLAGRQTTYCYSHDYHVLCKGLSIHGNAITHELEKKLNGRDDYGLMFYTLTGSHNARGYPTFLIIFERRDRFNDTRVHFHRTHPSRSKDGDYNPIHHWTAVCYNWMVGNIKRDRIAAQQGDLAFVKIKTDKNDDSLDGAAVTGLEFNHKVEQYDNHCFAEPVAFAEYTKKAKSNILGYVKLDEDTVLNHNEHDNETIPAGTYAIHQCRSWEANPKGVWSLTID